MSDDLVPFDRPPVRRPDGVTVGYRVESDNLPEIADPMQAARGRVEFLMFGYTASDGQIVLVGSKDVSMVEIETEYFWGGGPLEYRARYIRERRHTLTADLGEYGYVGAPDLATALHRLAELWREM